MADAARLTGVAAIDESRLRASVRELGSAVIAYSGGVDSATLLAVAAGELGERVLAVTGRSPSLASGEAQSALRVARAIGAKHEFIATNEFDNPNYVSNPANRCYYCKDELYGRLTRLALERGFAHVADGCNADDGTFGLDMRPGRSAAKRHGVRSPLAETGFTKAAVRDLARRLGLRVWDKPATPCLSSRIPHGARVEPDVLRRIDLAERYLRARGFREVRVRHFGAAARIEVPLDDVARLATAQNAVTRALRAIGYERVEIDPRGYRMGSLNDTSL